MSSILPLPPADVETLRRLGAEFADVARLPIHREKVEMWRRLNDLEPARPMVWINEIPWHEMNTADELTLRCSDAWARDLERTLRRTLCQRPHIPADMRGCPNAQILSGVSPAMHWEFAVRHDLPWLRRWGLDYYGCCEQLDGKLKILRRIPRLRKISVSPWGKLERAARAVGSGCVFSRKPNPAVLAAHGGRPQQARAELVEALGKTRGLSVEVIMKDISTVRYEPQRLWEWQRIAMEEVERFERRWAAGAVRPRAAAVDLAAGRPDNREAQETHGNFGRTEAWPGQRRQGRAGRRGRRDPADRSGPPGGRRGASPCPLPAGRPGRRVRLRGRSRPGAGSRLRKRGPQAKRRRGLRPRRRERAKAQGVRGPPGARACPSLRRRRDGLRGRRRERG